ncbi:uncharacterized protein [Cherax quadricarinatus]|uniref:uncharacterized protein n=1 Tax=Cherax quadricarinatus TaxID=27406 RepID=UPI002377D964|nr:uncharacterized protein LOC128690719 [Cherax quadricarinatus]
MNIMLQVTPLNILFSGRTYWLKKLWETSVTLAATALLVYQVSFSLTVYLDKPTIFMLSLEPIPVYRLPQLSICPYPPFEPRALNSLGLNQSTQYLQYIENYMTLLGIPNEVTAGELWQRASWNLGQVIKTTFLDEETINYKPSETLSSLWRRSYSPLGPCLTLNAPEGMREALIILHGAPPVKPCMIPNENGTLEKYNRFPPQCERISVMCNSSCGLEDAVYYRRLRFDKMNIYFHETPVYADHEPMTEEDTWKYSDQLFDGNYILMEISKSDSLGSYPQLIDSSFIKGACESSNSYSHSQCFRQLHIHKTLHELGCYPLFSSLLGKSSKYVCSSPHILEKMFWTEYMNKVSCPQRCKRQRWTHDITTASYHDFTIILKAMSTDVRRETELETYPLSKFFSDMGGSLGLFLGLSVLSFLEFLITVTKHLWGLKIKVINQTKKRHIEALTKYTILVGLSILTSVHCLEALRMYLTQPRLTAVSIKFSSSWEEDDIITLVSRRLATRALDCRPEETRHEECMMWCLLEGAVSGVAPFLNLEGLPACQQVTFSLPSYVYLVPPELLLMATLTEKVEKCRRWCLHLPHNKTTAPRMIMSVDKNYYSANSLQLISSIGGIIGLYLGYSIFDFLNYSQSLLIARRSYVLAGISKKLLSTILRVIKITILLFSAVLACWQVYTFLINHMISSSIKQTPRARRSECLSFTVCRWPPLSLPHVATQLRLNITEADLLKLPREKRQPELLRMLEAMPGNWSVSLDELWFRAAWNITDVVEGFQAVMKERKMLTGFCNDSSMCQKVWKPVMTPLNRCFSLNAVFGNSDITEITLIFPQSLEKTSILGQSPQIYFTVNPSNEPVLMANMVPKTAYHRIIATHHTASYKRLGQDNGERLGENITHSSCVHRCLSEGASDHLHCRLPYVSWRPDLDECDQNQYTAVHRFFKGLGGIGDWNNVKDNENVSQDLLNLHDKCYKECRHLQHTFFAMTVEKVLDKYPTVVVRFSEEEEVVVREEDRYPLSSLLSDLGCIAGTTAGFSLLFVLKELVPRAMTRGQPHT